MHFRECLFRKIVVCGILLLVIAVTETLWAGPVSKIFPKQTVPTAAEKRLFPITTESGNIEIVTDLEGRHFWQVSVTNTSDHDAKNFMVIVTVEGFRKEDKVQTVGTIDLLSAGRTAYARAELPDFEGMHQMRIKIGGTTKTVEIPRPFRKDANGSPLSGLEIEKVWAQSVGGKLRWYLKTKPNIYATIEPKKMQYAICFRERKQKYCHNEEFFKNPGNASALRISYKDPNSPFGGTVTNPTRIGPGESVTLSGELNETTAAPHLPQYMDRMYVKNIFSNIETTVELDRAFFYAPCGECPY